MKNLFTLLTAAMLAVTASAVSITSVTFNGEPLTAEQLDDFFNGDDDEHRYAEVVGHYFEAPEVVFYLSEGEPVQMTALLDDYYFWSAILTLEGIDYEVYSYMPFIEPINIQKEILVNGVTDVVATLRAKGIDCKGNMQFVGLNRATDPEAETFGLNIKEADAEINFVYDYSYDATSHRFTVYFGEVEGDLDIYVNEVYRTTWTKDAITAHDYMSFDVSSKDGSFFQLKTKTNDLVVIKGIEIDGVYDNLSYAAVTCDATEHGSLSATKWAYVGETVIVTVTPDEGYKVQSVSYVPGSDSAVPVEPVGDVYSFVMPSTFVHVNATFVEDVTIPFKDIEVDFSTAHLGASFEKYLVIDGENNYSYEDEAPSHYNAHFVANSYNGSTHGYVRLKAYVPVEAGNYKITLGRCEYNNNPKTACVKNEAETQTLNLINEYGQAITTFEPGTKCYKKSTGENTLSVWFVADADQTIAIVCAEYTPYIKIEKVTEVPEEEIVYTVTFDDFGAEGTAPATQQVVAGNNITIPANRTLYWAGKTLDSWYDGADFFEPGETYTPTADVKLHPVFMTNSAELLTATTDVTVTWDFRQSAGAPAVAWQNRTGDFLVAQATIGTEVIDVKLNIDTNPGKFATTNDWCQVNVGTTFTFPSKAGITMKVCAYSNPETSTLDGNTYDSWESNVATYSSNSTTGSSSFISNDANGNQYFRYIQVSYPKSDATAIDNANADTKATKLILNGQLIIKRGDKTYTVTGQEVR